MNEEKKEERRVQFHSELFEEKIERRGRENSLEIAAQSDDGVFNTSTLATTPKIPRAVNYKKPAERAFVLDYVAPSSSIQRPNYEGKQFTFPAYQRRM